MSKWPRKKILKVYFLKQQLAEKGKNNSLCWPCIANYVFIIIIHKANIYPFGLGAFYVIFNTVIKASLTSSI